ncbi:MAG TPA: pilus assembly protein TadG-related protein [Acetobacteraceae bacterium]|nr:pilus assembly protein TadG-related protein [Acetobacteraceae bacterium]
MTRQGSLAIRRRRGAVAVMIAVMLPVVVAAAGLGVDYGIWQREAIRLQLAADAAAMGAGRLLPGHTASVANFQAAAIAEANAVTAGSWVGTLNQVPGISVAEDWSSVAVTLSSQADSYFSRLIGVSGPTLHAGATSGRAVQNTACVLALSGSAASAILVDNMGSITATGCGIFSDSNSGTAIYLNSGSLVAQGIAAVGTVAQSDSGSNTMSPAGTSGAAAEADPFASLVAPTAGACNYNNASFTAWKATAYQFNQSANVFCGNTTIGGNGSTDMFAPGIYYVVDGSLTFDNAAITQATGVSFVLTGSAPGAFSWTNYSSTPTTMTAPTTGPTAGMLVWQTCPTSGAAPANSMNGGSTLQAGGQFYAPCGALDLNNDAHLVAAPDSALGVVASTMHITGSGAISANSTSSSGSAAGQIALIK